ncbi:hypothetical protein ACH4LN_31050 [Streptomyces albus]|uniref:FtsK domain-containing protein n=1 Tax=Streptomyces albus TaxID=1888 RepID=A0A8H1LNI3_9ACTN|nr:hypothetical protein D8771_03625 [Streptomyces albus]
MTRWTKPARPSRWRMRNAVRAGAHGVLDVCHPLLVLGRGLRRLAARSAAWWRRAPRERRGPALFLLAVCGALVWLLPYGRTAALLALLGAAAWHGRERAAVPYAAPAGPDETERTRLRALYEALVPYFAPVGDPAPPPLYTHGGDWTEVFEEFAFRDGRISELLLCYPAWFRDGEPAERLRIEAVLAAKTGREREYRFCWDQEGNRLEMTALEPLPTDIPVQPFVTAPGEAVLGFTDGPEVRRTVPVRLLTGAGMRDVPPVLWRTGPRSTEPHLLAVGLPGAGTSSLLRSLALQALCRRGDVLIVDGDGGGEFACLAARHGVLGVETTLPGALSALEWADRETERRLLAAGRARQRGEDLPQDVRRPLWVLLDRPTALALPRFPQAAGPDAGAGPGLLELLRTPLRHGRAAGVTVVVAEPFAALDELPHEVFAHARARVVLGAVRPEEAGAVLGQTPQTGPPAGSPPGRGFARLGTGPVLRLQVPATPDPFDETAGEAARRAVWSLLPGSVHEPSARPAVLGHTPAAAPVPPAPARPPTAGAPPRSAPEAPHHDGWDGGYGGRDGERGGRDHRGGRQAREGKRERGGRGPGRGTVASARQAT